MVLHAHPVNAGARGARRAGGEQPVAVGRRTRAARRRRRRWHSVAADDPVALGLARSAGARRATCPPRPTAGSSARRRTAGTSSCSTRCARPLALGARSGVPRTRRGAGAALVRAAAGRPAGGAHRHGHRARARRGGALLRDLPRRPAPLLAPRQADRALRVKIVERPFAEADRRALVEAGVHPVLARIYAGRRIRSAAELDYDAAALHRARPCSRASATPRSCSPTPLRRTSAC